MQFKQLHPEAVIPTRGTLFSAGWDLTALETVTFKPTDTGSTIIRTGIAVQLPEGYYGRIALRSGYSKKTGNLVNAGVVDIDYDKELMVLITPKITIKGIYTFNDINGEEISVPVIDDDYITIKKGEKFAQIIAEKYYDGPAEIVTEFRRNYEAHLGFGSTDAKK